MLLFMLYYYLAITYVIRGREGKAGHVSLHVCMYCIDYTTSCYCVTLTITRLFIIVCVSKSFSELK